jgi:cell division protein ZapA (FtsZ GTPase activity inhibitor)
MFICLSKVFIPTYVNLLLHYKPRCMNEQNNEIGNQLVVVVTTLFIYIAIVQEITQILFVKIPKIF